MEDDELAYLIRREAADRAASKDKSISSDLRNYHFEMADRLRDLIARTKKQQLDSTQLLSRSCASKFRRRKLH